MKDLNFFSSYSKKKERKVNISNLISLLYIFFICFMLLYAAKNYTHIIKIRKDLLSSNSQAAKLEASEKIKEIKEKEEEVEKLKADVGKLKELDEYVSSKDIISEELILAISNNIPADLFLSTMMLSEDLINIEGYSMDRESIFHFQYNVSKIDTFKGVFVPDIAYNENYYSFKMDIKLKEVEIDESEAEPKN